MNITVHIERLLFPQNLILQEIMFTSPPLLTKPLRIGNATEVSMYPECPAQCLTRDSKCTAKVSVKDYVNYPIF